MHGPPPHARLRRVLARAVSARRVDAQARFGAADPGTVGSAGDRLQAFLAELVAGRAAQPGADLVSELTTSALLPAEVHGPVFGLLAAGLDPAGAGRAAPRSRAVPRAGRPAARPAHQPARVVRARGAHCLGAAHARLQLEVGLRALLERFPRLTAVGEPDWQRAMLGLQSRRILLVRW